MKKLAFIALFSSVAVFGQTKNVIESDIHWWGYKVAKSEASSHDGKVNLKAGNVVMKGNDVVGGTFVLDMNTINATDVSGVRQQKLNAHLKEGDFFEVEKFPTATYKITSVTKNNNTNFKYTVNGNLTVKGKTSAVSFPANIQINKGTVTITSDKFSFDRQKFDITYKSSMKDVFVKDDIDMVVKVTVQ